MLSFWRPASLCYRVDVVRFYILLSQGGLAPCSTSAFSLVTYAQAEAYLLALPRFATQGSTAFKPGLARMRTLLEAMGQPHTAYPSVHIAGTNGKGSTASLLAAMASASGRKTGLHTSPHLQYLGERMRVDGMPAPEEWLADAVARFRTVFDAAEASFFEVTTALSFLYFAEQSVDVAVIETGLGGRLDATNILKPVATVITHIGLDHTDLLGDTLAAIAREKAGILKHGAPLFTAVNDAEALVVLRTVAAERGVTIHEVAKESTVHHTQSLLGGLRLDVTTPVRRYAALQVGLPGHHQTTNALLALRVAEDVFSLHETAMREGLADVRTVAGLRGRLEVLRQDPLIIADVAHNPDGLATALSFAHAHRAQPGMFYVMLGLMKDKAAPQIADLLARAGAHVLVTALEGDRALSMHTLAAVCATASVPVVRKGSVAENWQWLQKYAAPSDTVLVAGSHQVVAPVLGFLGAKM